MENVKYAKIEDLPKEQEVKEQKMKDKYYTPEAKELHIDFEFEYSRNGVWYEEVINDLYDAYDVWKDHEAGRHPIRVKYLDHADIESLGFEIYDYDDMDSFSNGNITIEVNGYTNELIVEIWTRANTIDKSPEMVFKGTIKNKSELKKILKQIGYGG